MNKILYVCGDVRVDPANRRVSRGGQEVAVEPRALSVLLLLLARAGELIGRDELLDAVWGHRHVTPATLNRVISVLRRVFGDDADDARFIATVHGSGYRFIGGVECVAVPRHEVRAYFGPPPIAELPAKLTPLIGRDAEIAQLGAMLAEHRAVTIIGPGGMGKTQCALEVARRRSGDFADGVWFFDLTPFEAADEWISALAAMLSLPASRNSAPLARIGDVLAERCALLLLDNCDRLAAHVGERLVELLRRCPQLKVLATSRRRLDFTAERLMWLPPLELPPRDTKVEDMALVEIAATPAVALLLERARAVQPAIALDERNAADIVRICHRLDGMPLALELVAGQFAMLSPAAIAARLDHSLSVPQSGTAGRPRRHQTLGALVDWSYSLLSAHEQRLLCWLGVFQQGWTIDAAEAFGSALGADAQSLLDLHSGLIFKSLVVADPTLSPPRYRLLETVREFALERLHGRGEYADARGAHLRYFVQLAERSHREIPDSRAREWVERLDHEDANIDAALAWAKSDGEDAEAALRLAGSLMLYGKATSRVSLLADWAERALAGVAPQASQTYVLALLCSGVSRLFLHDGSSEPQLAQALALATQLGDRWTQACASAYLAAWNAHQGRLEHAVERAGLAARLAADQDDPWLHSLATWAHAWIAIGRGEYERARADLEPLRGVSFDPQQRQLVTVYLSLAHYALGDWRQAAATSLDVVDSSVRLRSARIAAAGIEIAAYLAMEVQRPDACARLLGKAEQIRDRTRTPLFSFWSVHHDAASGRACTALGEDRYTKLRRAGAAARDEIVVAEARTLLMAMCAAARTTASAA